jgi:hypothetical protein
VAWIGDNAPARAHQVDHAGHAWRQSGPAPESGRGYAAA